MRIPKLFLIIYQTAELIPFLFEYANTKLQVAVRKEDTAKVRQLIKKGANVNAKDKYGMTALHWVTVTAADADDAGAENVLMIAKLLIDNGADVNAKGDGGGTPLHTAASLRPRAHTNTELVAAVVKLLIDNGADVNAKDRGDGTPLDEATRFGDKNPLIKKLLIDNGATD